MKNRWIIAGFLLISLLAFFLWLVLFQEKAPRVPNSPVESPQKIEQTAQPIEQDQPEIRVSDATGLIERDASIYVGSEGSRVDWDKQALVVSGDAVDIGYAKEGLFYGILEKDLVQVKGSEYIVVAEQVKDVRYLDKHILYLDGEGLYLLSVGRNTIQRLLENEEEDTLTSLESIDLAKGTDYYVMADRDNHTFDIYLTESKELLSIVEGQFLSASPVDAIVAYAEEDHPARLGVYYIEDAINTQIHLTTEGEEVISSPTFDGEGRIHYLTRREGMLYSNLIELENKERTRTELVEAGGFKEELWIDGYYVISFRDRFYYGKDTMDLSYYELSFETIRFGSNEIYLADGSTLRVIKGNQYKEYSLKGDPVEMLPGKDYLYYTFYAGTQPFVSRVQIVF